MPRNTKFVVRGCAALFGSTLVLPGCMLTAGLVSGPVAGPVSAFRHDAGVAEWVLSIPAGIWLGACRGGAKDFDFFTHGSYVAPGTSHLSLVFDPFAGILGGAETLYPLPDQGTPTASW